MIRLVFRARRRGCRCKNISKRGLLNRRSLGFARDDKGEGPSFHWASQRSGGTCCFFSFVRNVPPELYGLTIRAPLGPAITATEARPRKSPCSTTPVMLLMV